MDERLKDALIFMDVEDVKNLLESGVDPNGRDDKGETALHHAAKERNTGRIRTAVEVARLLVEKGANVNAEASDGKRPLHYAFSNKEKGAMAHFLLESGANPNAVDNEGSTPLLQAVLAKDYEGVEELLRNLATPNVETDDANSILSAAIRAASVRTDILALLLLYKPHVSLLESNRTSSLHVAATNAFNSIISGESAIDVFRLLLLAEAKVDAKNKEGDTVLSLLTARMGRVKSSTALGRTLIGIIRVLVDYNATIQTDSSFWYTDEGREISDSRESRISKFKALALRQLGDAKASRSLNLPRLPPMDRFSSLRDWIRKRGSPLLKESLENKIGRERKWRATEAASSSSAAASSSSSSQKEDAQSKISTGHIRSFLVACKQGDSELVSSFLRETPSLVNLKTGTGKTLPEFILHVNQPDLLPILSGKFKK